MKDYFLLAWKNIHRRKLRSWLTLIGIFIGIFTVVALISIGYSLQSAVSSQFSHLEVDKITIQNINSIFGIPGSGAISPLKEHDVSLVKRNSNAKVVYGQYSKTAKIVYNNINSNAYIIGIPSNPNFQKISYQPIKDSVYKGKLLSSKDARSILVGSNFNNKEYYGREIKIGDQIIIDGTDFKVLGILKETGSFTNNMAIFMLDKDIEDIKKIKEEYDLINVYVKSTKDVDKVVEEIKEAFRKDRKEKKGEESFTVTTSKTALENINNILSIIKIVVVTIAVISLIIGGIGVANTMFTSVLERRNEIGIQKAIGAKNTAIQMIFLFEAGLLCLIGGVSGAISGLLFSYIVVKIASIIVGASSIAVTISWALLLGASLFSFVIGLIAGYFPAKQASKLNPVVAMRK